MFKNTYLKSIFKWQLLEFFMKKLLWKTFNIHLAKVTSDKCPVKKVFLMVDRAVKVTRFYIDQQHLS